MNNKLVQIIVESRKKQNISQRELARRIEIDNAYLSRIEKGEIEKPSIVILMKLSRELKINFSDLLFLTYTPDEIDAIGVFNNINDAYHFIEEEKINEFLIDDENNNKRISIIKVLEEYKNKKINLNEILGLLSCITGKNCYNYLTRDELKSLKNAEKFRDI